MAQNGRNGSLPCSSGRPDAPERGVGRTAPRHEALPTGHPGQRLLQPQAAPGTPPLWPGPAPPTGAAMLPPGHAGLHSGPTWAMQEAPPLRILCFKRCLPLEDVVPRFSIFQPTSGTNGPAEGSAGPKPGSCFPPGILDL